MNKDDLVAEEAARAKEVKALIVEQLQEHTADTLDNIESALELGLALVSSQKQRLAVLAKPLP